VNGLPEDEWRDLSGLAQDWFNDAALALKADQDIPDPATYADQKILRRWKGYGVTRVARKVLKQQGPEWCKAVLKVCDKRKEADGGDPEIASRLAKSFAKNPSKFVPDYGQQEEDGSGYEEDDYAEDDAGDEIPEDRRPVDPEAAARKSEVRMRDSDLWGED
jgi:hypothetical protein